MQTKQIIALAGALLLSSLATTGCGAKDNQGTAGNPIVIKVAHTDTAQRSTHRSMEWLAEYMATETDGRVVVELYPDGQLGDDPELCRGILTGDCHVYFGIGGVLSGIVGPRLDVVDLPFLYNSYDEWVEGSFTRGGLTIYNQLLEGTGYTCVDFMYNGMMNLCSARQVYHSPAEMAGFKVRVATSEINVNIFRALGAEPVPLAWGQVYTAMAQGEIDGLTHSLGVFNDFKFYELAPYITLTEHQSSPYTVVMSSDFLASLPKDIYPIWMDGLHQACAHQREMERELEQGYVDNFLANGATVHASTPAEKEAFYAQCASIYAAQREITGADSFDRFLATAGK